MKCSVTAKIACSYISFVCVNNLSLIGCVLQFYTASSLPCLLCIKRIMFCLTLLVSCPPLTIPNDGMINCSLGDDEVFSYEDNCSFTCNTGYELTGSDTRTCQSNGSWSGSDDVCRRGISSTV